MSETPLTPVRWKKDLDLTSKDRNIKELLEGNFTDHETKPPETVKWLMEMKIKDGVGGEVDLEAT